MCFLFLTESSGTVTVMSDDNDMDIADPDGNISAASSFVR